MRIAAALCSVLSLTFIAAPAAAYHSGKSRITDDTAHTLRRGQFRLGLFKAAAALGSRVELETLTTPWLLRAPSLFAKWTYYRSGPWALAVETGFITFDSKKLADVDDAAGSASFAVLPFELWSSYTINADSSAHLGMVYTAVHVKGSVDDEELGGAAEGALDNFQATANYQLRLSKVTALVFAARYLVLQRVSADGRLVLTPDEFTTLEIEAAGSTDAVDFKGAFSILPSVVWSWQTFNLRLGLGYGNYNVPKLNFTLGSRTLVPDFDLFWVF